MLHLSTVEGTIIMATKNPRISVMLKPESVQILSRLSAISKQSKSSIIAEFLEDTCMPMLERMVIVLEAAANASEDARAAAKQGFADAEERLLGVVGMTTDLFEKASAPIMQDAKALAGGVGMARAAPRRATARPPHVTRGSGTPNMAELTTNSHIGQAGVTSKPVKRASAASKNKVKG
jgi:hypothetical protein